MKSTIVFLAAALMSSYCMGQNTFPATGSVGIGTNSPTALLDVRGEAKFATSYLTSSNSPFTASSIYTSTAGYHNLFGVDGSWGSKYFGMKTNGDFLINGGNIGMGIASPTAKLDIAGSIALQSSLTNTSSRPSVSSAKIPGEIRAYSFGNYGADDGFLRLSAGAGSNPLVQSYIDLSGYSNVPDMNMNIIFGTNGVERMRIHNSGNIGIGTATPAEKLSVKGKIRAQEIKVELTGWADFVFAKGYKLPSLQETENHIKENGHLPGIPSAAEVAKDGVDLGEMNKKLLQKIEELTLHLIEQNRKIEKLETGMKELKKTAADK